MLKKGGSFHVIAPVAVALVLVFGAWGWLRTYTRHNAKSEVPDLKGLTFAEAQRKLAEHQLLAEVIDSVYNDDVPKSTVTDQDPDPGKEVKPDRTVYLVMNASTAKMIDMPHLKLAERLMARAKAAGAA